MPLDCAADGFGLEVVLVVVFFREQVVSGLVSGKGRSALGG